MSAEKLQQEFEDPHDLIINDELTQLLSVHSVGPLLDTYEITIAQLQKELNDCKFRMQTQMEDCKELVHENNRLRE